MKSSCDIFPQTALRELLRELLTPCELRQLLFDVYGHSLLAALPASGTPAEMFYEAVDVLDRRGMVGAELFRRLVAVAPGKDERIREVAARWGLGAPGPDDPRIALVEGLHTLVKTGAWLACLEHVRNHAKAFFPGAAADERGWITSYSVQVVPDDGLMVVEALRVRDWASGTIRTTAHVLLGDRIPLFRVTGAATGHNGTWMLTEVAIAAIERCLVLAAPRISPVPFGGRVSIYMGSRGQLDTHAKLAAWSAAKDAYYLHGALLRTTEGFIDQQASQALGERWFTFMPPDSPLRRAP
jgi:hypothetical protein